VVGIAFADRVTSLALEKIFLSAGYDVLIEWEQAGETIAVANLPVDVWVFDARSDSLYNKLSGTGNVLLPADNPPPVDNRVQFDRWAAVLLRQIDAAIRETILACVPSDTIDSLGSVKAVWILAGSAGATTAVQSFLNAFHEPPPVAFIYAQHYGTEEQYQLHQLTAENPAFTIEVGDGVHRLAPGRIILVPPRCKISFDESGHVATTRSRWKPQYTPNIEELFGIVATAMLPSSGVIVFSGMGRDGVDGLPLLDSSGVRIWAQTPASAVCDSMPRAAIGTGLVQRSGNPAELAAALRQLYSPQ
jgi:chemotaxis response regulator CheB